MIEQRQPDGWAYQYPDCIRFETGGRSINGNKPIKAIGLYFAPTVEAMMLEAKVEVMYTDHGGEG